MPEIPGGGQRKLLLAIDPGVNGGIVCLYQGSVLQVPMPSTDLDVWNWIDSQVNKSGKFVIPAHVHCFAVIEKVSSSPQMGVTSAFTFGHGYGFLKGCLTALGIPFEEVRPQVWQKFLAIPPRVQGKKIQMVNEKGRFVTRRIGGESDTEWKQRLRARAQQLYPSLPLWKEPKSIGRQLAVSDALLIAEFARRSYQ